MTYIRIESPEEMLVIIERISMHTSYGYGVKVKDDIMMDMGNREAVNQYPTILKINNLNKVVSHQYLIGSNDIEASKQYKKWRKKSISLKKFTREDLKLSEVIRPLIDKFSKSYFDNEETKKKVANVLKHEFGEDLYISQLLANPVIRIRKVTYSFDYMGTDNVLYAKYEPFESKSVSETGIAKDNVRALRRLKAIETTGERLYLAIRGYNLDKTKFNVSKTIKAIEDKSNDNISKEVIEILKKIL